jgi:succinyl-diaminopimelate desuccinylase
MANLDANVARSAIERAREVEAWLRAHSDQMFELLEELITYPTENPPGSTLGACGLRLHQAFTALGLRSDLIELPPARELEEPCVVRGVAGEGAGTVYFHGHFDVVPAQSRDQFHPRRENGEIVGRGSADMKSGLVSMLYGAAAACELGLLGDTKVVLHFVCDEETGSAAGSAYLRDNGLIDSRALGMLTAEPTGGAVWHASRGAITMRVQVHGREAHVGHVHLGDNAFEKMLAVARPLVELSHELLEKRTAFPAETDAAHGSMLVVGGAAGAGANFNVVPGSAWFSIDRRFNPEENLQEEVARLTDTLEQAAHAADAEITIEILQREPSAYTEADTPPARALADSIEAVEEVAPAFVLCPGVLETRWYAQLGIPAFGYGPGKLDVSHGPDERVDEDAVRRCAAVYALFPGALPG